MRHLVFTLLLMSLSFTAAAVAADGVFKRNVDIEWEAIEGAKNYEVEFVPSEKPEKIMLRKSETAIWSGPMSPGTYKMRVRAKDRRGVPGSWSEAQEFKVGLETALLKFPLPQSKIQTDEAEEAKVEFKWNPVGGAESYTFELTSEDGKTKIVEKLNSNSFTAKLPVGTHYTWKVKGFAESFESDAEAMDQFTLLGAKLKTPKIETPDNLFVRELKWSNPEHAEQFAYSLSRLDPKTKTWEKIDSQAEWKSNSVPFNPLWRGGKYRLAVKAKGQLRASSDKIEITFKVREGDRSPASEEIATVRESIERLSGWYGMASYLITVMDFKGKNYDFNSDSRFNGVGGTGRLGAGFLSPNSSWGFLGVADMSGITLEGYGNYTFASVELSGIYRNQIGNRGELRQHFGVFYKELPELIADFTSGTNATLKETNLLKYAGPLYAIEYWHALNSKTGLQVNAHLYQVMQKVKMPADQNIEPSISAQMGALASYRLRRNVTGLLGYAYRIDEARYKSNPDGVSPGRVNSAVIEGHYLNLFLEWAL